MEYKLKQYANGLCLQVNRQVNINFIARNFGISKSELIATIEQLGGEVINDLFILFRTINDEQKEALDAFMTMLYLSKKVI